MSQKKMPGIPLPRGWPRQVQAAIVHVMSLAQYAAVSTRSWAVDNMNGRVRLKADKERLQEEVVQLREEIRIKDARMARIPAPKRPHYTPIERMQILELRAARGWSLTQTAKAFQLTPETVAAWMKRLDEGGPRALLQLPEPVNRFPDLVRYLVQRLKLLCPSMGKVKIAENVARAGLHLGKSTVGRMLHERPAPRPHRDRSREPSGDVASIVIQRSPSPAVGISSVPRSSRLYHKINPPGSHHNALIRSRRRLTNRNRWPSRTFISKTDSTIPLSPSKPRRKSTG